MIVGIAGGSCSGKSTMATLLAEQMDAAVISVDDYFGDPSTFPKVYGIPDYDRLEAIDWPSVMSALGRARGNVVIEGFLILAYGPLRDKLDVSFFIDADTDTLIQRRLVKESENKLPKIDDYVTKHLRSQIESLVLPSKQYANVVLDGTLTATQLVARAQQYLRSHRA